MSKPPEVMTDEIIEKYSPLVTKWDCYWDKPADPQEILEVAKKCAIIYCEGIIDALKSINPIYEENTYWHPIDYYQQVLTAIKSK